MIELSNLDVVFGRGTPLEKQVLHKINLTMNKGSFVTVIGSNGAGKSTMLGVLAGRCHTNPWQGGHRWPGRDPASLPPIAPVWSRACSGPAGGKLRHALTIEENLALAASRGKTRGLTHALNSRRRTWFRDRVASLNFGLENRMHDRMELLSGGQRQKRLSLIMAAPCRFGGCCFWMDMQRRPVPGAWPNS
ncbi:ATP-binding cassette domain-containing protein [Brucella abortus]|nr:ATP-binding cassette domain-containing protein [Brucella abortus]